MELAKGETVVLPSRGLARAALLALVLASIGALTAFRIAGSDSSLVVALEALLPAAFIALTVMDFRAAVAVTLFELSLMGAGGSWAHYGGGITGRHLLVATVTARAVVELVREARGGRERARDVLGRYGVHAVILSAIFPAVWMPLGIAYGNARADVLGDGNGLAFFAFALVPVALLRRGDGPWLRRCFFIACAVTGIATGTLISLAGIGILSLADLRTALLGRLDMGGVVGTMPNGAFRLFLGSGIYLQVAIALTTWELLRQPRRLWPWVLYVVLWGAVIGSYTRGLWIGAVLACGLVLVLGCASWRRPAMIIAVSALLFLAVSAGGIAFGRSLPDYVVQRGTSTVESAGIVTRSTLSDPGFERRHPSLGGAWTLVDSGRRSARWSVNAPGRGGGHALVLRNDAAGEDDYVAQVVKVAPRTRYTISAWVDASRFAVSAAARRALFVWDPENGVVLAVPMTTPERGWRRLAFFFETGPRRTVAQIRLYAPKGVVAWDDVRLVRGTGVRHATTRAERLRVPPLPAAAATLIARTSTDVAGGLSNTIRAEQLHVLVRHIRDRPVFGSGFGAIAHDYPYGTSYAYELSYLHLLFKAGAVGLLLFLSFPLRLVLDALRARVGHLALPRGVETREASVVVAIVLSILVTGATNPFLFAAFGLCPIVLMLAWLDGRADVTRQPHDAEPRR